MYITSQWHFTMPCLLTSVGIYSILWICKIQLLFKSIFLIYAVSCAVSPQWDCKYGKEPSLGRWWLHVEALRAPWCCQRPVQSSYNENLCAGPTCNCLLTSPVWCCLLGCCVRAGVWRCEGEVHYGAGLACTSSPSCYREVTSQSSFINWPTSPGCPLPVSTSFYFLLCKKALS